MSTETKSGNTGKKIWYGFAIAFCGLVILLSLIGVVGTWVVSGGISRTVTQVLVVVENTAGSLSATVGQIDQGVAKLDETATRIRSATDQISQNITDKGLVLTLLPEEREQELATQANDLQETVNSVVDALNAGLELYQTIDSLPFVSLPKPQADTIARLEKTIADTRSMVTQIVEGIRAFREGVSQEIDNVTGILDQISAGLGSARENLAQLNNALLALQELAARARSIAPVVFNIVSLVLTLFLAWVIYTQVEVIRQYTRRWKSLNLAVAEALPAETPPDAQPATGAVADLPSAVEIVEDAPAAPQAEAEPELPLDATPPTDEADSSA